MNRQINQQPQHITAQAPVQPEQLSRDDQFAKTIIDLERRYKIYDPKSQMYSQEAVDQTVELMSKFISGGDTPVLALLKAGDRLGPYYSQKIYDEMLSCNAVKLRLIFHRHSRRRRLSLQVLKVCFLFRRQK